MAFFRPTGAPPSGSKPIAIASLSSFFLANAAFPAPLRVTGSPTVPARFRRILAGLSFSAVAVRLPGPGAATRSIAVLPRTVTVSSFSGAASSKLAPTVLLVPSVKEQRLAAATSQPLHPLKMEPAAAVAVRVTAVPWSKRLAQSLPQAIPAGGLATEPLLDPATEIARERRTGSKLAPTPMSASRLTRHSRTPEQPPPDHPESL